MESILNQVVARPPEPGHRVSVVRLADHEELELTDLYARSEQVALGLRARGLRRGDRVGIVAANGLEWLLFDLAALRSGLVTAGFEPASYTPTDELCERYDLALLFTDMPIGADAGPRVRPTSEIRDLAEVRHEGALEPVEYGPEDATALKFTSGSTGRPKCFAATAASTDGSLRAVQAMFDHGPGDDLFCFLPLSLLQQRFWLYSALYFGHDLTVSTYEAVFAAMPRARPTVVMGVPSFYEAARRHVERRDDPVAAARALFGDRIRYLWTGSAPAHRDTLDLFTETLGTPLYEGWGLNEACIVTKNHPGAHRPGSVGRPLPGKEISLDEDGVVVVRSERPVARDYTYCGPGDSERMFRPDGSIWSGDLGHIDDDGFLYIRGRADDMLVLGNGRNVVPRPIEDEMKKGPAVDECVLFCVEQTKLVAAVSPATDPPDEAAIKDALDRTNAVIGRDRRISRVVVAPEPFSIANQLLTSQFKPRRKQIYEALRHEIQDSRGGIHAG